MPGIASSTWMILGLAVLVVMLAAAAVVAFQERSASKAKRRAKGSAGSVAAGVSLGAAALFGIFEGLATGGAGAIGEIGAVFLQNPSFTVDLGLIGWGAFALAGPFGISLKWFLVGAVVIVAFGLALREAV